MLIAFVAVVLSLILMVWSADRFVDGAIVTAKHYGMAPLLVGMVVVGFGTSAPEMAVSVLAASQGNPDIALGNAYGSNITNIALILGLSALIYPIVVPKQVLRKELPILLAVTAFTFWLMQDGRLGRLEGMALLFVFGLLMFWNVLVSLRSRSAVLENGLSIRAISKELGISRNSVRKYVRLDEASIAQQQDNPARSKQLDAYRGYLINLLASFPGLSAVKIARKLTEKLGELPASDRSIRRYVSALKEEVATGQLRYYEPVVDEVPGVQCQVDPGELRNVMIGGVETVVHFVVFVLAYSRLMYVGLSLRPLDTQQFIQLHDEAFRYFGGLPEECVYDQTKLVVIEEKYRELKLNERFHQYATTAGFRIHACEGYAPESKGKVEAGVKYVKRDCLYGEVFRDEQHLRQHVLDWLETVANVRTHGTTGESPRERFARDELAQLKPYLSPPCVTAQAHATRKVDKTGLISWKANRYSVPMAWQQGRVGVQESGNQLNITDLHSGEVIARHELASGKGQLVKNTHHYRDHAQRREQLEQDIQALIGDELVSQALCQQLRLSLPKVYKDQLYAVRSVLRKYSPVEPEVLLNLSQKPGLTATRIEQYLMATQLANQRERHAEPVPRNLTQLDLSAYQQLGQPAGQGVTHGHA